LNAKNSPVPKARRETVRAFSNWGWFRQAVRASAPISHQRRRLRSHGSLASLRGRRGGRRMMGSGEQGVPICFTTFWAFALRLRTLNEIALPAVPMGTMLSAGADYLMTVAFLLKPERPPATGAMGCSRPPCRGVWRFSSPMPARPTISGCGSEVNAPLHRARCEPVRRHIG
jgi:hypothetical protein